MKLPIDFYLQTDVVKISRSLLGKVLVRGIFPLEGVEAMVRRRKAKNFSKDFTTGPGKVSQALGIDIRLNGVSLTGNQIWIEDVGVEFSEKEVQVGHRVGVGYAGEDAFLPYRFRVNWETASNYSSMLRR